MSRKKLSEESELDPWTLFLNAANSSSPNVRYAVGKDAESVLKARTELSDRELEKWVRESYMDKKGFIRQ